MSTLTLRSLRKAYGPAEVIKGIDLDIADREFVVFVGPSGCGKSTLLRMIAGLEAITAGELMIDGRRVNEVGPADRGLAMVFQSYALYPHMTVAANMGFALRLAGVSKADRARKVDEAARILQLGPYLERRPKDLSGGQRQRVAIGRAIVRDPKVFLFDEPLSNLDAELRVSMRGEISALHERLGATMIYVTHDQVEAMTMADKIVVLRAGRIEQVGSPLELYNRPANRFIAGFIGTPQMNFVLVAAGAAGTLSPRFGGSIRVPGVAATDGAALMLGVRPEHLGLEPQPDALALPITATHIEQLGGLSLIYGALPAEAGRLTLQIAGQVDAKVGDTLTAYGTPSACHVFEAGESGRALRG